MRYAGSPASAARPCVIVQRDGSLMGTPKLTVCPLTTRLGGDHERRPHLDPTASNGLREPCEVEVDWVFTHPIDRIGPVIGRLDPASMVAIDRALRRWLQL